MTKKGEKLKESAEKKEYLQLVLQILEETAEKFRTLHQEAETALQSKKDAASYKQKIEERANLLINLPNRLSGPLENINLEIKQRILQDIKYFATSAQKAQRMETTFGLAALLTHKGDKISDKNDLEKLIAFLKKAEKG